MNPVEGVIAVADVRRKDGEVFTAEELRKMADGRRLFFDDVRRALVYRGPASAGDFPEIARE